jgi:hypothetical protein
MSLHLARMESNLLNPIETSPYADIILCKIDYSDVVFDHQSCSYKIPGDGIQYCRPGGSLIKGIFIGLE